MQSSYRLEPYAAIRTSTGWRRAAGGCQTACLGHRTSSASCRCRAWRRAPAASSSAPTHSSAQQREAIPVEVVCATTELVLSACAALRIACFYHYPGPKSGVFMFGPDAQNTDCQHWLEARMRSEEGRLPNMIALGMRVASLAALAPSSLIPPLPRLEVPCRSTSSAALDGSSCEEMPCDVPHWWRRVRDGKTGSVDDVVGTLDIHVGARLPSEVLEGSFPMDAEAAQPGQGMGVRPTGDFTEADDIFLSARDSYRKALALGVKTRYFNVASGDATLRGRRAYIFNVCVLPALRRRGIASKLILKAHDVAIAMGVEVMYIHVEEDNPGAKDMYESLGYELEKEEEEWLADRLGRPRRLLLRKDLQSPAAHPHGAL